LTAGSVSSRRGAAPPCSGASHGAMHTLLVIAICVLLTLLELALTLVLVAPRWVRTQLRALLASRSPKPVRRRRAAGLSGG
jgi:hypothetical protein